MSTFPTTTIVGYPRIGRGRELKKLLEAYWKGAIDRAEFDRGASQVRLEDLHRLAELGLARDNASIPLDVSYYDQVADLTLALGAIAPRFGLVADAKGHYSLDDYFTIARGNESEAPLEMTKWFDSNYHYLVPEIGPETPFTHGSTWFLDRFVEAQDAGFHTRPVLVGPVTFLLLAKASLSAPEGFPPLDRLPDLLTVYREILVGLKKAGATWVQLDESGLVSDNFDIDPATVSTAVNDAYRILSGDDLPNILLQASYGELEHHLEAVATSSVAAVGLDLHRGGVPRHPGLAGKVLVGGVIDGRNIWRGSLAGAQEKLEQLRSISDTVAVSTSTSLFHVPHSVSEESTLSEDLRSWLAFADEKICQVVTLGAGLTQGWDSISVEVAVVENAYQQRLSAPGVINPAVRARTAGLVSDDFEREDYEVRRAAQEISLQLPKLPTTTIGSFPQTNEIRIARAKFARREIDQAAYEEAMREEIGRVVRLQEELGLDVLVHGEPERNDMVQYFAEHLNGFAVTTHGWVQSYGSRCTRPSILWGDVTRQGPITIDWSVFAQSLTSRPVKGMLTGPVTIMAWSFVRDDIPSRETGYQLGLALLDEVTDLEKAGIKVIQVDEPAIRELLPLKERDHADYLDWAVRSFRLATSGVTTKTQIHTHLCYSEFGQIFGAINGLGADVTSIEAARSKMDVVEDIRSSGFERGVGPGVWDIHSPRVPDVAEQVTLLSTALAGIADTKLWVNPDCGLKTRDYAETIQTLTNLVEAARRVRATLDA